MICGHGAADRDARWTDLDDELDIAGTLSTRTGDGETTTGSKLVARRPVLRPRRRSSERHQIGVFGLTPYRRAIPSA